MSCWHTAVILIALCLSACTEIHGMKEGIATCDYVYFGQIRIFATCVVDDAHTDTTEQP